MTRTTSSNSTVVLVPAPHIFPAAFFSPPLIDSIANSNSIVFFFLVISCLFPSVFSPLQLDRDQIFLSMLSALKSLVTRFTLFVRLSSMSSTILLENRITSVYLSIFYFVLIFATATAYSPPYITLNVLCIVV